MLTFDLLSDNDGMAGNGSFGKVDLLKILAANEEALRAVCKVFGVINFRYCAP